MWDTLWIDAHLATMAGSAPYGAIRDGAIAAKDGRIVWVGARADLPGAPEMLARNVRSAAVTFASNQCKPSHCPSVWDEGAGFFANHQLASRKATA